MGRAPRPHGPARGTLCCAALRCVAPRLRWCATFPRCFELRTSHADGTGRDADPFPSPRSQRRGWVRRRAAACGGPEAHHTINHTEQCSQRRRRGVKNVVDPLVRRARGLAARVSPGPREPRERAGATCCRQTSRQLAPSRRHRCACKAPRRHFNPCDKPRQQATRGPFRAPACRGHRGLGPHGQRPGWAAAERHATPRHAGHATGIGPHQRPGPLGSRMK